METSSSAGGEHRPETLTRRRMLAGTAAVAGVAALAACSSGDTGTSGSGTAASPGDTAPGSSQAGSGAALTSTADVPQGGGVVVTSPTGPVVVTQPAAGEFKAFTAKCPHAGCTVSTVRDDRILCPCHGSVFDATTGARLEGPATSGLTAVDISVDGSSITLA